MIQLYTGDGKGKTTAAVGACVRAAGCGWRVLFTQFMKGNDTGELEGLNKMNGVRICRSPENFGFYSRMTEEQKMRLRRIQDGILEEALEMAGGEGPVMIVLDEITHALKWNLVDPGKVKKLLEEAVKRPTEVELVLTGRDPSPLLLEAADYITKSNDEDGVAVFLAGIRTAGNG